MDATLEGGRARDRRHTVRQSGTDLSWLRELQLRPGHDAILVNLSAGGALVETPTRLSPGTRAVLRLSTASCRLTAAGRVSRSWVSAVLSERGILYRGAVVFDAALDLHAARFGSPASYQSG